VGVKEGAEKGGVSLRIGGKRSEMPGGKNCQSSIMLWESALLKEKLLPTTRAAARYGNNINFEIENGVKGLTKRTERGGTQPEITSLPREKGDTRLKEKEGHT